MQTEHTCVFADNNSVEWVPTTNEVVLFHLIATLEVEHATVRNTFGQEDNTCVDVDEANFCQTADNLLTLAVFVVNKWNGTEFVELYLAIVLGNDRGIGCSVRSNTTGVESTKGKLRTRFTNSLCSNDTYCLAHLYHTSGGKVAAIALLTYTALAFAREHRTYLHHFKWRFVNDFSLSLCDFFACGYYKFACRRIDDIVYRYTTENALVERSNDFVAILQRTAFKTTERTTVLFGNDNVVRNVYQTTSEVSCIGSLHSGIGKTLTGTV